MFFFFFLSEWELLARPAFDLYKQKDHINKYDLFQRAFFFFHLVLIHIIKKYNKYAILSFIILKNVLHHPKNPTRTC